MVFRVQVCIYYNQELCNLRVCISLFYIPFYLIDCKNIKNMLLLFGSLIIEYRNSEVVSVLASEQAISVNKIN